MRTGWLGFCTHLLCSFSLYTFCSLLLTILLLCNNYNSLHAFASSRPGGPNSPTISVAFCSKGRMIVYDKFIRIQSGHMIQSLLLPSRWRWLSPCRMWIPFLFLIFVFAPDIVQLLSFFTWLQVYWKTQALILMRCTTRLWNGLVKLWHFEYALAPDKWKVQWVHEVLTYVNTLVYMHTRQNPKTKDLRARVSFGSQVYILEK
jgi:hypothetical protein